MNPPLSLDVVVTRSPDQVSADLSGEVVILGMRDSVYYGVDQVAARVWALLQTPMRLQSVVDTLLAEYDVAAADCADAVLAFVSTLEAKGLVTRVVDGTTA